jgi:hypothetical protein
MAIWWWWFLGAMAVFLPIELYAHFSGKFPTLSQTIWNLSLRYRFVPFLFGGVVGVLSVHFFGTGMCP